MPRTLLAYALAIAGLIATPHLWADDVDFLPPAGYYASATGAGATLKGQLQSIMTAGHIQRRYGDFRQSAAIHDADPNNAGNILLVYDRRSIGGAWTSGSTWNREHVWPQSLQPGSASNSSRGNLGDPHALRPSTPAVNSNRGNKPFGNVGSSGSFGGVAGGRFFPGDTDAGDVSRSLFYSATRYSGLTLVSGSPGSNQMGDLDALIDFHFRDVPDEFERRRNQAIFSSGLNPSYYTNNRNAYVDHPEFVWSVFVDNENDSSLWIDGAPADASGASTLAIDFGRVYAGEAAPSLTQSVTLNKSGQDGTYYEVTPIGGATSSVSGRYNAMRTGATDSRTFDVGLTASTATAGTFGGAVFVDNLDITTGGGVGRGAQDADDVIAMSLSVLNHPVASFSDAAELRSTTIDFGQVPLGSVVPDLMWGVNNLDAAAGGPGFAADLDLDTIIGAGDTGAFDLGLSSFAGLGEGGAEQGLASFVTDTAGDFEATYTLNLSGEDLPGERTQTLSLTVRGEVVAAGTPGDFNGDGRVDNFDLNLLLINWGEPSTPLPDGWDGTPPSEPTVDNFELNSLLVDWGVGTAVSVPEPHTLWLLAGALAAHRRRGA